MKIAIPCSLLLTIVPIALYTQSSIATWNFDGIGTTGTEILYYPTTTYSSSFTAAGLSRGAGIEPENAQDGFGAKGWDKVNTTAALALAANEYFILELNVANGQYVNLTSLQFVLHRNNDQGPTWAELRSNIDNYTTTLGNIIAPPINNPQMITFTLPTSGFNNLTGNVIFRLIGYGANNPNSGTFIIGDLPGDDIIINGSAPLPVELAGFHARRLDGAVALDWETKTETDSDFFAVERSADGRVYEELDRMPGAGNSTLPRQYRWTDPEPLPGRNYYRLRQTDFDGVYAYSPVVSVLLPGPQAQLRATLVHDQLLLEFGRPSAAPLGWRVVDALGRVVSEGTLEPELEEYRLPLDAVPGGIYWLHLGTGEVLKFYKKS